MNREALFGSDRDDWETPHELYAELDKEFHFTLDPCSNDSNYKCKNHFTKEQDGLSQNWGGVPSVLQSTLRQATCQVGTQGV